MSDLANSVTIGRVLKVHVGKFSCKSSAKNLVTFRTTFKNINLKVKTAVDTFGQILGYFLFQRLVTPLAKTFSYS